MNAPLARIQLFFLIGISAIALYFSVLSGIDLVRYLSLKSSSSARISQWQIIPLGDKYGLKAKYWFEFKDKNWRGSYTLAPPYYLNEKAALYALKEKAKEPWRVWYNPNHPHFSVLEKKFPGGILFRTTICFGVLLYFLFFKRKFLSVSALK